MGNRRILLFFAVGILLCLVILFAGRGNRRFLAVPDQNASFLVKDIFDDVDAVVVERAGRRIEIRREGARWRMTAPIDAGVDKGGMNHLISGFDSVVVKDRLSFDEIRKRGLSVADYGLYPARARIAFHAYGREYSFLFGSATAAGNDVYVRKNSQNEVLVVPRDVYDVIPQGVNDLRSRRLVDCDPALVRSVDIRRPGHPFIRLAVKDGVWYIEEPVSARASLERVDVFLKNLFEVRVSKFVWPSLENVMDVADFERALEMRKGLYGLDDDSGISINIQTVDGNGDSGVVIGRRTEKIGQSVYALLDHGRAIGAISNSIASVINVEPEYFRGMRIFDALEGRLEQVQIMKGEDLFVVTRTNDLWHIDSPVSEPADQKVVQRSIDAILALKADRIVHRVTRDESGDQGVESSYIEFSTAVETVIASLKKADYEGMVYEFTFADSPEVYYVAGSNMPPVLVEREALLDFRDKTLLALPKERISRVTIRKSGETALAVEYIGEDQSWHPAGGSLSGRLNREAFERVLKFLDGFSADRVVKVGLSVNDLAYYGFAEPWLEINLDVDIEDAVRRSLLIGRSAGGNMRYVMVRGDQSIFLVDEQRLSVFAETMILKDD